LAAAIQSFWFGLVLVVYFALLLLLLLVLLLGFLLGGLQLQGKQTRRDEKRREEKRRKERCLFLKGFELIYQSVSLHLFVLCLTAAIHRHFAASRSLSFVFQQSPSARLRLRGEVSLLQILFSPSFCVCEVLFFFFSAVSPRFLLVQDLCPFFSLQVSLLLLLLLFFLGSFRVTLSFSVCIYLPFAARPILHLPFVSRFAFLDNLLLGGGALINEDRAGSLSSSGVDFFFSFSL
jgi:hypothetical protein